MADVPGKFYRATKVRTGVAPSSAGSIEGEVLPPVNPPGSSLNSVGLTMPSAFTVSNSPLTANGTIGVTGAGTVAQYIRGDGSLADFPESSGGGSSVSYYLNGSVDQGTIGGVAYKELSKVPILGAGTDFTINADGYIASFITDAGDPNLLEIPGGNWNFETYFSASSSGGTPTFYVELYKVSGTTATLIASSSSAPELIAFGTNLTPYFSSLAVPTTTLALTDRLAVRYYVTHSGRTITLHTENNHLCQIITTFTTGLTALNGLTAQVQNFAVGTTGTDFNIASATATHTFNLPTASATNRGALSSADWSLFTQAYNDKINSAAVTGTTTKTLTLTQQDGGTITASWSDLNTDAVLSVFGRTGAVVAANGDYTTAQVTESGNLYYTDARSRAALSFASGSGAYNTSTGVITIPTNNNQITNGAGYITSAALAGYLPLIGGTMTGNINWGQTDRGLTWLFNTDGASIKFYNTEDGDTDSRLEFATLDNNNEYFRWVHVPSGGTTYESMRLVPNSSGNAQLIVSGSIIKSGGTSSQFLKADGSVDSTSYVSSVTASTPLASSGGTTPNITIQQASGSQSGFLSSTDWTTFNNKQNALTNPVTGTGTTNYLPKFTGSTTIGNSPLFDASGSIGLNTLTPALNGFNRELTISAGVSGTARAAINIQGSRTSSSTFGVLGFFHQTNYVAGIESSRGGADNSGILQFFTSNAGTIAERLQINSSGNLGLGVTPSAWNSAYKAMQFGTTGAIFGESGDAANYFTTNTFVDSVGFKYITSDWALGYFQENGVHSWRNAPSGTAGNAISFTQAMTLTSGGNLILTTGTVSDNGARLQVSGTATFTNTLTASDNIVMLGGEFYYGNNSSNQFARNFVTGTSGSATLNYSFWNGSSWQTVSTLNSTGAATFSSSVTATAAYINNAAFTEGVTYFDIDTFGGKRLRLNNAGNQLIMGTNGIVSIGSVGNNGSGAVLQVTGTTTFSSGNVLIGTTTDNGARLQVSGTGHFTANLSAVFNSTSNTPYIRFDESGSAKFFIGQRSIVSGAAGTGYDFYTTSGNDLQFFTGGSSTSRLAITSGGNVGIGTPSPANGLLVINSTAANGVRFALESSGTMNGIVALGSNAISGLATTDLALWTRGVMAFETGASGEKMRITSGGNVLIGQTLDLGHKLHVSGTGFFSSTLLVAAGNNGGRLRVGNLTNAYAIAFEKWNSSLTLGGFFQNSGSSGEMILVDTNGSQNVLISSSGNSYFNASSGNVLIGTTTSTGDKLRVAGNTFSNTIMTWNPENDNRSGVAWRLGAASIGAVTPNRRLRVNVGGVEYYIGAVEV